LRYREDTRPSDNLVKFSKGVDVLIHELLDPEIFRNIRSTFTAAPKESIIAHRTLPEQAGEIFPKVNSRLAVFSHTDGSQAILDKARKTYAGRLEMGDDLMVIAIDDRDSKKATLTMSEDHFVLSINSILA
jgi:ribonuclease Z